MATGFNHLQPLPPSFFIIPKSPRSQVMDPLITYYKDTADKKDDRSRLEAIQDHHYSTNAMSSNNHNFPMSSSSQDNRENPDEAESLLRQQAYDAFQNLPKYFSDPPSVMPPPLPLPVLIPQRRQADRLRGFQLLYAPQLANSGVTEQEFITFLNRLNVAIGFDNKIKIFNFAIDIGTLACSSWEVFVATLGTQALTTTAAHVKSRAKSEAYIAHANERFFHPRGLHTQLLMMSDIHQHLPSPGYGQSISQSPQGNSFQFSVDSPFVLPEHHPKAKGGLFNLNKRPITYDPFDYGPGYVRISPSQYCQLRPSQYKEPAISMVDKVAEKVEKYNVWQDRLPAKKSAKKDRQRQETIDRIRATEGERGVMRFLQNEENEHREKMNENKNVLQKFQDRQKVVLIITNLNQNDRILIQRTLACTRT